MACPLASVVTRKGLVKFGNVRIGSKMRACFRILNASSIAKVHRKGLFFFKVEVIGDAMRA